MSALRILLVLALCGAPSALGGCKKKKSPPKELASLSPEQACKHFFGRVKRCAASISRLQADKLSLKGEPRAAYLQKMHGQLKRSLSNLDLVCQRYALKTRKQQTEMDGCYRERTCDAFAQCFAKMADADVQGPGGQKARSLKELRKRLEELKKLRPRNPGEGVRGPRPGMRRRREPGPMVKPTAKPTP